MELKEPLKVYVAQTNVEAHLIVEMLRNRGLAAFVEEDQSGVGLWFGGTISQFHRPNIWVERAAANEAAELIARFETEKRARAEPEPSRSHIEVPCEECGTISLFADTLNGTTQECPHCGKYVDVGQFEWDEDVGEPEDESAR